MARRTSRDIAEDLRNLGVEGKVIGVHSNISSIGLISPSPVSESEKERGLSPIAKTVINAFVDAVGPEGTFFVPTHSLNFIGNYSPDNFKVDVEKDEAGNVVKKIMVDDGYYRKETSESLVGAITQAVILDDRSFRSDHPTHSIAAIGKEAEYLVCGHTPFAQPVGIHNGFAKVAGLDGIILFIGDTVKSNTSFHAYETLAFPKLGEYFVGAAAADYQGLKRLFAQTWTPNLHRDFYAENKRPTRAITCIRESGLLKKGKVGRGGADWFNAKEMANYFVKEVLPKEPDILFCSKKEDCAINYDCRNSIDILKSLYGRQDNGWDEEKIKEDMDRQFLQLLEPGEQRVSY
jgi:aminoglycoside 3-N-acetyltransferase